MRYRFVLFLTLLLTTVLIAEFNSISSIVCAQELSQQKFRKIYVPEDRPDSWPTGNWQPISSKKYFQLLEESTDSAEQLLQAGLAKIHYQAVFRNGQLVEGKLAGRIHNPRQSANWQNLGRTNLHLQSLKWKQGEMNWGNNPAGDFFILQQQNKAEIEGKWSLNGHATSQGTRFNFEFFRATQTTLQLTLPANMQLQLGGNTQVPFFAKEITPNLREWTIHLSSQSTLTIIVNPVSSAASNSLLLSRQIHLLTLGVSKQKFVTDFQIEIPGRKEAQVRIFLPDGFKTEQIEIQQEKVSLWKTIASGDDNSKGVIIPVSVRTDQPQAPVSIRLSGELERFSNHQLTCTFPKITGAVQAETQVTLSVESPLHTTELSTKSLQQIDARVGPGVRDTWTYTATGIDPGISISVAVPTPRLQADQLILCTKQEHKITELKHLMFWTTNDEGFFTGKFRLLPGYEIREVLVFSDLQTQVPSNWNIRTEKDREFFLLHLPNQLVPGQKLAVSVTLRPKSSGKQQTRISLPALQLLNGDIEENLLLAFPEASLKYFPANAVLKSVPFSQLKKWSAFWGKLAMASEESDRSAWIFKDISAANRIIIKPDSQTDKQKSDQVAPLSFEKQTPAVSRWLMVQDFPKRTDWACRIKAILHQNNSNLLQVQVEYIKQNEQGRDFVDHLSFSDDITLHSITINGHCYSLEKSGTNFSIPDIKNKIESVIISYSTGSLDYLPLPATGLQVTYDQFLLCLPQHLLPSPDNNILLWQKLSEFHPADTEVDPAFAENHNIASLSDRSTSPFDSLFAEYRDQLGYRLYEAHFASQLSSGNLSLDIRSTLIPWFFLFWMFLTILVLCLFLNILFQNSHQLWLLLSILFSISAVMLDDRDLIFFLFPATAALFVAAQLPGSFLKWLINKTYPTEGYISRRSGSLRYLLTGTHGLLLISFWLNTQAMYGQPIQKNDPVASKQRTDLLIPVKPSLLTEKFQGLQPADYPEIIYLSEKFAGQLKEMESRRTELNEILFRSARYDVVWSEQGIMQVHCQFRMIDSRKKQSNSFRLPLSGIESLPTLKATVDGQSASINPLPDGSGLEIPLPEKKTAEKQRNQLREYLVELDVIPQSRALLQGTEFTLGIPPIAQCQMSFQFPGKFNARLVRSPQDVFELTSRENNKNIVYQVGAISQLNLILDTAAGRNEIRRAGKFEQIQTSLLAHLTPQYLSLRLHTNVKFVANSDRTIKWKLPPRMAVRSVHALANVEYHLNLLPEEQSLLELKIPDSSTSEHTILVDLILPLEPDKLSKEIPLPDLIEKLSDLQSEPQWQIALQAGPGFELYDVEFPSIITSRITPAVFNQNWPEQKSLSQYALCYRLQKPSRFKVKLHEQESELTVIAEHQFYSEITHLHLHSQYQVDVIGTPLWSVTCDNPIGWELDSVQMSSEETLIPVRVMKQNGKITIAFAERIDDACLIDVRWKLFLKKVSGNLKVTPPRIPQTLYYRENLKAPSSNSDSQWLLSSENSVKADTSAAPLVSAQDGTETLEIDADDPGEMPEIQLQQRMIKRPLQSMGNESVPAESQIKSDEQEPSPEENENLQVEIDHTLWREQNNWLGETLIMIPLVRVNHSSSLDFQIPANSRILSLSHHQRFIIKVADNVLSVRLNKSKQEHASHIDFGLILIQWMQPHTFSWTAMDSLLLPGATTVNSVSWRVIDYHSKKRSLLETKQSWKTYLLMLSELESDALPLENSGSQLVKPDTLFQQVLQQIPQQQEGKIFSALQKLPRQSWNQPLQHKMIPVIESGRSASSLRQISIASENHFIRYAIWAFTFFWGWGMWQTNHARQTVIRRRHLALCSFLLIGLIAVLMIS